MMNDNETEPRTVPNDDERGMSDDGLETTDDKGYGKLPQDAEADAPDGSWPRGSGNGIPLDGDGYQEKAEQTEAEGSRK